MRPPSAILTSKLAGNFPRRSARPVLNQNIYVLATLHAPPPLYKSRKNGVPTRSMPLAISASRFFPLLFSRRSLARSLFPRDIYTLVHSLSRRTRIFFFFFSFHVVFLSFHAHVRMCIRPRHHTRFRVSTAAAPRSLLGPGNQPSRSLYRCREDIYYE